MSIYSFFEPFKAQPLHSFADQISDKSEWMGYPVVWIKDFSKILYNHVNFKTPVFIAANLIFLTNMLDLAEDLEDRVKTSLKKLDAREIRFNMMLIDYIVVGASMLIFNVVLSKMMGYPLSRLTLAIITIGSIVISTFSHQTTLEAVESFHKLNPKPGLFPKGNIENKETGKKKPPSSPQKAKGKKIDASTKQELFIHHFCNEISLVLKNSFHYVKFNQEQKNAQSLFLESLKKNVATIEEPADLCRAVCVPIQAAFEKLLVTMLKNGYMTEVTALYLTPLPCTPLRTPLKEIDSNKEMDWKEWTGNIRTQTVRLLRKQGASIIVCYNASGYEALPAQSLKGKEQFDTYENEKIEKHILDHPLLEEIPQNLVGALYFITDAHQNHYILATQGVQAQNHGETPTESWKMWFGPQSHPEIHERSKEILEFVSKDHPHISLL